MKSLLSTVKNKFVPKYLSKNTQIDSVKSTDINILLNRVRQDQIKERRKKILFSAATSAGILLFGVLIF